MSKNIRHAEISQQKKDLILKILDEYGGIISDAIPEVKKTLCLNGLNAEDYGKIIRDACYTRNATQ